MRFPMHKDLAISDFRLHLETFRFSFFLLGSFGSVKRTGLIRISWRTGVDYSCASRSNSILQGKLRVLGSFADAETYDFEMP